MYQPQKLPDHLQKTKTKQAQATPQVTPEKSTKPEEKSETTSGEKSKETHLSSRECGQKSQSNSLLPLALAFLLLKE